MIHGARQRKFSRDTNARKALLKNLANDLILRERIVTTTAKAKGVKPYVEKLVTKAKSGSTQNRRILTSKLGLKTSVSKLMDEVGPTFVDRPGGYTRITKLPPRSGDNAPMAIIEFVEEIKKIPVKSQPEKKDSKSQVKAKKETKKAVAKTKEKITKTATKAAVKPAAKSVKRAKKEKSK